MANSKSTKAAKTERKKTVDKNKKPNLFRRFVQYCRDVKAELKRVTWPTKQEIGRSSLIVVGALVFFGLLIFAIDSAVVPLLQLYSGLAV
jgi:preprotein translocase subunit SecE